MKKKDLAKIVTLAVFVGSVTGSRSVLAARNVWPINPTGGARLPSNNVVVIQRNDAGEDCFYFRQRGWTDWPLIKLQTDDTIYGGCNDAGNADNNVVSIGGSTTNVNLANMFGAYAVGSGSHTDGNEMNIKEGTINLSGSLVSAAYATAGVSMSNNKISVTGGSITGTNAFSVFGGYGYQSADGKDNSVEINGGIITNVSSIYGGYISGANSSLTENKIHISGGNITYTNSTGMSIFGASGNGLVEGNSVEITGGTISKINSIRGGATYTVGSTSANNKVLVTGGDFTGRDADTDSWVFGMSIYGGSGKGLVEGNSVEITNGKLVKVDNVVGGYTSGDSNKGINNFVFITGGELTGYSGDYGVKLRGAYGYNSAATTSDGILTGNIVKITGGTLTHVEDIMGVYGNDFSPSYKVNNNSVVITGGGIIGLTGWGTVIEGADDKDLVERNRVEITGGTITNVASIKGGVGLDDPDNPTNGKAKDNVVIITGGDFDGSTGYAQHMDIRGGDGGVDAVDNRVEITGGTFKAAQEILGGFNGKYAAGGTVSGNSVVISDGVFSDAHNNLLICGGYAYGPGTDNVTQNTVRILGGQFTETDINKITTIYGGARRIDSGDVGNGTAEGNTVVLGGGTFALAPKVYGGFCDNGTTTDNTLSVVAKNVIVNTVGYFQNYNFAVPSDIGTDAMLTITGSELTIATTDTITVDIGGWTVIPTDPITLIDATAGLGTTDIATVTSKKVVKGNNEYDGTFEIVDGTDSQKLLQLTAVGSLTKYVDVIADNVTGNEINVTGAQTATITGGTLPSFDAGGTAIINWQNVYGGYVSASDVAVTANKITITADAIVSGSVYGGYSAYGVAGGADVTDGNKVVIDNSTAASDFNATAIFGGYGGKGASNNSVEVISTAKVGTVSGIDVDNLHIAVAGGFARYIGDAKNNTITIGTGTYNKNIYGGYAETGDVKDNTVNVSGGTIIGSVYAGKSNKLTATVSGNILNWSGGTISGSEIEGNSINVTGTTAKYLGTAGTITADGNVTLGDGTNPAAMTVGDGSAASALTFVSGLDAKVNSTLTVQNSAGVILQGTSTLAGSVSGAGTLTVDEYAEATLMGTVGTTMKVVNNGTLSLVNANVGNLVVDTLSGNGKIRIDANIVGTDVPTPEATVTVDTITAGTILTGTTLTLDKVILTGSSTEAQWGIGTTKDNVPFVTGTTGTATIATTEVYTGTSDGCLYKFETGTNAGTLKVTKKYGYNLAQIIRNNHADADTDCSPDKFSTYSLADEITYLADEVYVRKNNTEAIGGHNHYAVWDTYGTTLINATNLGTLVARNDGSKEFTIIGNSRILDGGSFVPGSYEYDGITVAPTFTLNLENLKEVICFKNYFVKNSGILNIKGGSTGTALLANITDADTPAGVLNITDAADVTLGSASVGVSITQKTLNIVFGAKLTANASKLILTDAISNEGTLTLTGGTLANAVTGGGQFVVSGGTVMANGQVDNSISVVAATDKLVIEAGKVNGEVTNAGTLQLRAGVLSKTVSGTGTTAINGTVTNSAGNTITQNGLKINGTLITNVADITIKKDASTYADITNNNTLVLTDSTEQVLNNNLTGSGTLQIGNDSNAAVVTNTNNKSIGNKLNIWSGSTFTSGLGTLNKSITNEGTFNTSGTLTKDISGNGTTVLNGELVSKVDATIGGSLNGNSKTVNMAGDNANTMLTVGSLAGTADLKMDVDLSGATAKNDSLKVNSNSAGATLNVTSINVYKDVAFDPFVVPFTYDDAVTYVQGTADGITYQLNGVTGTPAVIHISTATNNYIYDFTLGSAGKLSYTVSAADVTFKKFIEGELEGVPATLSLNDDIKDDDGDMMKNSREILNINLNGHTLGTDTTHTVTIGTKTMNLDGGTGGTVYTGWNVSDGGKLSISGNTVINGAIVNSGTEGIVVSGTATANGIISGSGSLKISGGTLTANNDVTQVAGITLANTADKLIIKANNLKSGVTNAGTVELTGNAALPDTAQITGTGTTNIDGTVSASVSQIQQNILINDKLTFTAKGAKTREVIEGYAITGTGILTLDGRYDDSGTVGDVVLYGDEYTIETSLALKELGLTMTGKPVVTIAKEQVLKKSGDEYVLIDSALESKIEGESGQMVLDFGEATDENAYRASNIKLLGNLIFSGAEEAILAVKGGKLIIDDETRSSNPTERLAVYGKMDGDTITMRNAQPTVIAVRTVGDITEKEIILPVGDQFDKTLKVVDYTSGIFVDHIEPQDVINLDIIDNSNIGAKDLELGGTVAGVTVNINVGKADDVNDNSNLSLVGTDKGIVQNQAGEVTVNVTVHEGASFSVGDKAATTTGNAGTINSITTGGKTDIYNTDLTVNKLEIKQGGFFWIDPSYVAITEDWTISGGKAGVATDGSVLSYKTELKDLEAALKFAGVEMNADHTIPSEAGAVLALGDSMDLSADGTQLGMAGSPQELVDSGKAYYQNGGILVVNNPTATDSKTGDADTAVIKLKNVDDITVTAGSKLIVYSDNFRHNTYYTIVTAETGEEFGELWKEKDIIAANKKFRLLVKSDTGSNYVLQARINSVEDIFVHGVIVTPKVFDRALQSDETTPLGTFIETLSEKYAGEGATEASRLEGARALNAISNMGELAAVQYGTLSMVKQMGNTLTENLGLLHRPQMRENTPYVRDLVAEEHQIDTDDVVQVVETGKATEIMPTTYVAPKYAKQVWASYIRSKDSVDGLQLGGLEGKYDLKQNGATVGIDLWSGNKSVGGVAVTYAKGDITSRDVYNAQNDAKYYGATIYNRFDAGRNRAVIFDVGYMNTTNDIVQNNNGTRIAADVKTNSITAGLRYEHLIQAGRTNLMPFAGVRYMRLQTKDYENSLGMKYEAENQNIFLPQVGLNWSAEFKAGDGGIFRPVLEGGYIWTLGSRNTEQTVSFMGTPQSFAYDIADKGSYYAKVGTEYVNTNFTFGLFYTYTKGDKVRNSRWNANASWKF